MGNEPDTISLSKDLAALGAVKEVNVPRKLGNVRLVREIGRGGMGVVWLGEEEILGRQVAVKFLLNARAAPDDPGFAAFLDGARAAAAVQHTGLTTIYHADLVEGVPYLVMEFIEGPSLDDLLRTYGPMRLPAALAALDAASSAVAVLHEQGIIHRDIKAGNIMVTPAGRVVVTDFGLALSRPVTSLGTKTAHVAGTPGYMAPEMFEGSVSLRTDVYALGITAFELLCDTLPFLGTLEEIQAQHRGAPIPREALEQKQAPEALIQVIERACNKDAKFRLKSGGHFARALQEARLDKQIWARAATDLSALAGRYVSGDRVPATEARVERHVSYYDALATRAQMKRQTPKTPAEPIEPYGEPPRRCPSCGYLIRDLPAGSPCPECAAVGAAAQAVDPGPSAPPSPAPTPVRSPERSRRARTPAARPTAVGSGAIASLAAFALLTAAAFLLTGSIVALLYELPGTSGGAYGAEGLAYLLTAFLPLAAGYPVYHALALAKFRADRRTRCGWCGCNFAGIDARQCPECGTVIGAADTRRASQRRWKLVTCALAAGGVYTGLLAIATAIAMAIGIAESELDFRGVCVLLATHAPAYAGSLVAYHFLARRAAWLDGVTRCGQCGGILNHSACAACSTRT